VDPDAFPRPGYAQPINTPELLYPVDAALGRLTRGDMSAVAALGVTEVIARGYFSPSAGGHGVTRRRVAPAVALFTYSTRPPAVTGVPDVTMRMSIFSGDAPGTQLERPIAAQTTLDPAQAWVDVRVLVPSSPDIATPFGGVFTRSKVPLDISCAGCTNVLAKISGSLQSDAGTIIGGAHDAAYHWHSLPPGATRILCYGSCAIALFSGELPPPSGDDTKIALDPLEGSQPLPWLASMDAPANAPVWIRYNVQYDRGWLALCHGAALRHFRIDRTINGWESAQPCSGRIWIVHVPSVLQAAAMLVALIVISVLAVRAARRPFPPPQPYRSRPA